MGASMEVDGSCASMEVDENISTSMEGILNGSRWKALWM